MKKPTLEELIGIWEMLALNYKTTAETEFKNNNVMYQTFISTSVTYTVCADELKKVLENDLR